MFDQRKVVLKKRIIDLLPESIIKEIKKPYEFATLSYSQEGEDILLENIFKNKKNGFYVDVGAYHPIRFSNSYKFYLAGWRGINIDATPGSMKPFSELRNRDINLEMAISDKVEELQYFIFDGAPNNTFSREEAQNKLKNGKCKIVETITIQTTTLAHIFEKYLPPDLEIDFLSIDVEGMDFKVLKSNDWKKFRPKIVIIEDLRKSIKENLNGEMNRYMQSIHYHLILKTIRNLFFISKECENELYAIHDEKDDVKPEKNNHGII
jgi:FkbM family methyltransferase